MTKNNIWLLYKPIRSTEPNKKRYCRLEHYKSHCYNDCLLSDPVKNCPSGQVQPLKS